MSDELDDARECARDWAYKCEVVEEKLEKVYDLLHPSGVSVALRYAIKNPDKVGLEGHDLEHVIALRDFID